VDNNSAGGKMWVALALIKLLILMRKFSAPGGLMFDFHFVINQPLIYLIKFSALPAELNMLNISINSKRNKAPGGFLESAGCG